MSKAKDDKGRKGASTSELKTNGVDESKEAGAQQAAENGDPRSEDEVLRRGEDIACRRSLMAQAFKPPCPEPGYPLCQRGFMLNEMKWLAVDVAQERLWKQTAALAVAVEIARMEGEFNLKQPPAGSRKYSDEIKELKLEAARADKAETALGNSKKMGRRGKAAALPSPAVLLDLDAENDPGLREIDEGAALLKKQAQEAGEKSDVVLSVEDRDPQLFLVLDRATTEKIEAQLVDMERQRLIGEEARYRSYRMEYEAALVSHQLAIAEQQAAANTIDAFDVGQALDIDLMDDGLLGPPRKSFKRRRGAYAEDYDGSKLDGYVDRRRAKAYRDDVDPNYSADIGRYGRRGAAARSRKPLNDRNRNARGGKPDGGYPSGRIQGQPGILSWSRSEDELLLAIVHEFGVNWTLVSEVLSRSLSMQGVHRPANQCRQRFRQLTIHDGQSLTDEKAYESLSTKIGKQQARDLLIASLPVRDEALVRFLEALAQVGASAKNRFSAEEQRTQSVRTTRQEPHVSYKKVHLAVMQQTNQRHLTPFELSALAGSAIASQRQMTHAGPGNLPGPGPPNQNPPGDGPRAPPGPAPGQQTVQGSARPAMPTAAQNAQQIQSILQSGKLPNGQDLNEEMRKSLEQKLKLLYQRMQQEKAFAARGPTGVQPGAVQGLPSGPVTSGTALGTQIQHGMRPMRPPQAGVQPHQQQVAGAGAGPEVGQSKE
jgi:hypothetical protein